ncbi:MAG: nucleotidyltransferase family protein [Acidimicrobiales bacterium]
MELPVDVDALTAVLRRHGVTFTLVFGSRATGSASASSDLDLAVWSPEPIDDWSLRGSLPDVVDLVDLRTTSDGVAGRVAMEGIVILDDDPPVRIRWQAETRKRYLDEAFRRERFRRDFVAAHG